MKHLTPRQCYLGNSPSYNEIFDFVDFGNDANTFLLKCGSKHEPTKLELASLACREPARLLGVMQSPEKYLSLLRTLANELPALKKDKALYKQMKVSKFLLGTVEIPSGQNTKNLRSMDSLVDGNESDEDLEDTSIKQYELASASQTVIVSSLTLNIQSND